MIPFTYCYSWATFDEAMRRTVMEEFAANGAKHLVLSDALLKMIAGDPKLYLKLPQEMRDAGLTFVDAHAPFTSECDLGMPVPEWRPQMLARQKYHLRTVRDLGVTTCTVHPITTFYRGFSVDEHFDAVRRSLEELLPLAETLGVTLALENIYKPCCTADDILTLIREFPSPCLGACYDSGHAHIMEHGRGSADWVAARQWPGKTADEVPQERDILDRMLPHMATCHLHDNFADLDSHNLPGDGTIDWREVTAKLGTAPKLRCIQSEVSFRQGIPIRKMVETFQRLESMISTNTTKD